MRQKNMVFPRYSQLQALPSSPPKVAEGGGFCHFFQLLPGQSQAPERKAEGWIIVLALEIELCLPVIAARVHAMLAEAPAPMAFHETCQHYMNLAVVHYNYETILIWIQSQVHITIETYRFGRL